MHPGLLRSSCVRGGDDVRRGLFDDAEAIQFQLTDDRCLPGARRTGDDEPSHVVMHSWSKKHGELKIAVESHRMDAGLVRFGASGRDGDSRARRSRASRLGDS
jgi:hypothetical protein